MTARDQRIEITSERLVHRGRTASGRASYGDAVGGIGASVPRRPPVWPPRLPAAPLPFHRSRPWPPPRGVVRQCRDKRRRACRTSSSDSPLHWLRVSPGGDDGTIGAVRPPLLPLGEGSESTLALELSWHFSVSRGEWRRARRPRDRSYGRTRRNPRLRLSARVSGSSWAVMQMKGA